MGGAETSESIAVTTQVLWDYRMDPPPFSFVTGSCAYINEAKYDRPGKPYGGGYEIFESMAADDPDMMLWLGDNVYLREVDFQSYSGFLHRYSHARQTEEMANLLKTCPNYAIWDDHDFGPNDSDGSWIHADWSRDAFKAFWSNPSYGLPEAPRCVSTAFRFVDMEFSCWTTEPIGSTTTMKPMNLRSSGTEANRLVDPGTSKVEGPLQICVCWGSSLERCSCL